MFKGLEFAKNELLKYLNIMDHNEPCEIELSCAESFLNEFDFSEGKYDTFWDDAYEIEISGGIGKITGVNSRSVLLGVYEFLSFLGCSFLRPSKDGELIPIVAKLDMNCKLRKIASYRHRGICIEGAVSLQHVIDIIDWAPKMGFNSYFIQFREGHTFFERWYKHDGNEFLPKQEFSREDSSNFIPIILDEIKKRGMIFHSVGHGWTCECIGYPSVGWDVVDNSTITDENRQYLAQVNGKREFFEGVPLNTHLCYSNTIVKDKMIREIVDYVKVHKEIDVLHFWLADNFNNFCECDNCKKITPTDHYINLLNRLDDKLTKANITTKIVFLIYFELLWTPKNEHIKNPDRFIMMFAPITRTYTKTYLEDGLLPDLENIKRMEFVLNDTKYPSEIPANLKFLFDWQKEFSGDSFDFDYHMMWDVYRDYSNIKLSKIIYNDIVGLKSLKLNGNISCQVQRAFFPNGLCMYVMGKALFDSSIEYETLFNKYFEDAYGDYSNLAKEYLVSISELVPHEYMRNEIPMIDKISSEKFENATKLVKNFIPKLENAFANLEGSQKSMMKILVLSTDLFYDLFNIFHLKASGENIEVLKEKYELFSQKSCKLEEFLAPVLDTFFFNMTTKRIIENIW